MIIIDKILPSDQYFKEAKAKKQIFLHHTAGSHRADLQVGYWAKDNIGKIATAYVIGGISTRDLNNFDDGRIYRAFEDKYWAYHLGLKTSQNLLLNKQSIGIEICNYGPLKFVDGQYVNYVSSAVPPSLVYKTEKKFRGFDFYHRYTDAQLNSTRELLLDIAERHSIDIKKKWDFSSFNVSSKALEGQSGLWTHCQVRSDKFDCSPQPELIDMLNSL